MAPADKNRFPTWMIVISIIVLAIPVVYALSLFMHIVAAMSIGGILIVAGIVVLFIWLKREVDEQR
jgi:Na+-driven multidrug efflux pump